MWIGKELFAVVHSFGNAVGKNEEGFTWSQGYAVGRKGEIIHDDQGDAGIFGREQIGRVAPAITVLQFPGNNVEDTQKVGDEHHRRVISAGNSIP